MAQGDVTFFEETWAAMHEDMNLETDTFKMCILDTGATPAAADAVPAYSGGTTNFNTDEVANGGNYATGGATLANPAITEAAGAVTFDTDDPATWSQDGSNPTDALYGLVYDDTTTIKYALCWIDIGGAFNMTTGDLDINVHASGWWSES